MDKKKIMERKEKKKYPILIDEDGQSKKLEEKKYYKKQNKLFDKDVNDPKERGWDQLVLI